MSENENNPNNPVEQPEDEKKEEDLNIAVEEGETKDEEELLKFPCENYLIKIVGMNTPETEAEVNSILRENIDPFELRDYETKPSGKGKYLSISTRFTATSRKQLNAIYNALLKNDKIKWAM